MAPRPLRDEEVLRWFLLAGFQGDALTRIRHEIPNLDTLPLTDLAHRVTELGVTAAEIRPSNPRDTHPINYEKRRFSPTNLHTPTPLGHTRAVRAAMRARASEFIAITGTRLDEHQREQYVGIWEGCDPRIPAPISNEAWNLIDETRRNDMLAVWEASQQGSDTTEPQFDTTVEPQDLYDTEIPFSEPEQTATQTDPDSLTFRVGESVTG